jgi:hypothetical protein
LDAIKNKAMTLFAGL